MKKIIIFLGAPGSGKGTQAKKLAEKYDYGHISTGHLLRDLQTKDKLTADEKAAVAAMHDGKLVPDEIIYHLAFNAINKFLDQGKGVILDGAVRSFEQAKAYQHFFKEKKLLHEVVTVEVHIPDEESYNRLANRRVCSGCGAIFPVDVSKPLPLCAQCGGKLTTRTDDAPETVAKRVLAQGNNAITPIKNYYKGLHELYTIDGTQAIHAVEHDIEKVLNP
jgi:adenylate kinase